jgi:hypothetical protein
MYGMKNQPEPKKADFSDLVGRWTPDPAFNEVIASQRQADWEKWNEGCPAYQSPHRSLPG